MKNKKQTIIIILLLILTLSSNLNDVLAETTLDCTNVLKSGAKGEEVKVLQAELNEVMSCGLTVDGSFGPATKSCVIKFQAEYSLDQDGSVGPKTCPKLNEAYLEKINVKEEEKEETTLRITTSTTLKNGSNNEQVKILQQLLNKTTHCNLKVDGDFGNKTEWCVKKYQEEHNLDVDGKVGSKTRSHINNYFANYEERESVIITKTSSGTLNVREDATTTSKDIGDVSTSEVYKILGTKTNSNGTKWYKIEYETGEYGYISSNYTSKNFIKLDISEQNLKLYRNGKEILNVPVVTGDKSEGYDTPTGIYSIGYTNDYTKNEDNKPIYLPKYGAEVYYWMSFKGDYGFHDAKWRSSSQLTDKTTYLTDGSHGCVNMFSEDAKYLYENVSANLPVHIVK